MKFKKKELIPIFWFITYIQAVFIRPVSDETYETLMKLCKDEFNVPVVASSDIEKAAVVKFWRANGKFTSQENILLYDGKKSKGLLYLKSK